MWEDDFHFFISIIPNLKSLEAPLPSNYKALRNVVRRTAAGPKPKHACEGLSISVLHGTFTKPGVGEDIKLVKKWKIQERRKYVLVKYLN